ncbi:MAG TPA: hypothetical protein VMA53_27185 [Stellaceae bacterium]|nr:hypothetical protein [Stellaceae bacterium]
MKPRTFISLVKRRGESAKTGKHQQKTGYRRAISIVCGWYAKYVNWTALATCVIAAATIYGVIVAAGTWHTIGDQLAQMQTDSANAHQQMLATLRPWVLVADTPTVGTVSSGAPASAITLAITYKLIGQSPAGNGKVIAFLLRDTRGFSETEYVKDVEDVNDPQRSCPEAVKNNQWVPFNAFSEQPQIVTASGTGPYVLVCARYDWSLDRRSHGILVMLYRLIGSSEKPSLDLRASYAG